MNRRTTLRLKFAAGALAILVVGWFVVGVFWIRYHRYESVVPGWRFGNLSGVVGPNYGKAAVRETVEPFLVGFKSQSPAAWYWHAPTNFSYSTFEIRTSRSRNPGSETNLLSVTMPSLAFRAKGSTGVLTATELRRHLIDDREPPDASPTVAECEWLIVVVKRAHAGTFPAPKHHGFDESELTDFELKPPAVFDASFRHFDRGIGFPWIVWVWVGFWALLVWIGARKWIGPRASNPNTDET